MFAMQVHSNLPFALGLIAFQEITHFWNSLGNIALLLLLLRRPAISARQVCIKNHSGTQTSDY